MNRWKNKTAWVIGASSGIGKETALLLNSYEASVIISSRREEELLMLKKQAKFPDKIFILPLDLFQRESFKEKTKQATDIVKKLDFVFLNGGTSQRGSVTETIFGVHQKLMDLNYFSYVALTQEILPFLLSQNCGHIIVTGSVMGKIGTPHRSAYAASKHALYGFFDCLRAEVTPNNIFVTLLTPGHVNTNISLHTLMPDGAEKGKKSTVHEKGISAAKAAIQILKAVEKKKKEVYIGKKFNQEHLSLFLNRLFPNLLKKIVVKKIPE